MTRFDAADPSERRKLFAEAITAHRQRGRGFVTLEADAAAIDSDRDDATDADAPEPALGVPWIQFADGTINLDCTDDELEAVKDVLGEFPAFKIDEINRPEEAEGVNVRVSAKADPNRIAQCLDALFRRVYDLPEDVRVWIVDL